MTKSKWFWFSFSHNGVNQGCCNVKAANQKAALRKTIHLGIHPKHDDIETCELLGEAELEPDRLFTRQEMLDMNY